MTSAATIRTPPRSSSRTPATPYDDSGKAKGRRADRDHYVYNDGSKTNEAVVPVVQENLKEIGVTIKEHKVPPTDLFSKYMIPASTI